MRPLVIGVFGTVAAGHSVTTNFLCTVRVRFAVAARFKYPCKFCVSQVQSAASQLPTPYGYKYRLFMASVTDCLWSVLGVNFLQTRLKWNVPGTCSVCLFV